MNRRLIWQIPLGFVALAVMVVAFVFLGWLVAILLGIGLFFNFARLRDRFTTPSFLAWGQMRRGIFASVVFLVVMAFWGGALAAFPKSTSATPTVTPVIASAAVPLPTSAPPTSTAIPPTATPVPPTATPIPPTPTPAPPTVTPLPPTPTPGLPVADAAYLADRSNILATAQKGLIGVMNQSQLAHDDPSALLDANWKVQTAAYLAEMQTSGEALEKGGAPPKDMEAVDGLLVTTGQDLVATSNDYARGVDTMNPDLIQKAVDHVNAVGTDLKKAVDAINAVKKKYGITQ